MNLIPWTTYGPILLLKKVWNHQKAVLAAKLPVSPYHLELTSILERIVNYGHTGNAAVIATTLMNPLWVGMSLPEHGTPTFNTLFEMGETATDPAYITDTLWPRNALTKAPYTASKRSQILNYGQNHWEVSGRS